MSVHGWVSLLADAYGLVEITGDTVQRVQLRPDVAEIVLAPGEETLWGAEVEVVAGRADPFQVWGAVQPLAEPQKLWLNKALIDLTERGARMVRVQIDAVGPEGETYTLTKDWPG